MYDHEQGLKNSHTCREKEKNSMCQPRGDPAAKNVDVYTPVNNGWKRSNAATVVEAV